MSIGNLAQQGFYNDRAQRLDSPSAQAPINSIDSFDSYRLGPLVKCKKHPLAEAHSQVATVWHMEDRHMKDRHMEDRHSQDSHKQEWHRQNRVNSHPINFHPVERVQIYSFESSPYEHQAHHNPHVLKSDHHPSHTLQNFHSANTKSSFAHATTTFAHSLAQVADKTANSLGTVGNCALGPRLTLQKFGFNLPAVVATEQGKLLEQSGLFYEVSRSEVRPGDYGYRHWTAPVIRSHGGIDKGDSFIVAAVGAKGELYGANDHRFVVPGDGDRYRDTKFLRPTAEFVRRYGATV